MYSTLVVQVHEQYTKADRPGLKVRYDPLAAGEGYSRDVTMKILYSVKFCCVLYTVQYLVLLVVAVYCTL